MTQKSISAEIYAAFEQDLKRRDKVSAYTIQGYLADLVKFAEWFYLSNGERMEAGNVTRVDLRDYKEHLQTVKKFKPATINRRLAALRVFSDWAVEKGLVEEDPVKVKNLEEPQSGPKSLSEKEYNRLFREVQKHGSKRDVAIIQLLRHAGLRVGELCNLELSDLQISERKGKVIVRSGKGSEYGEVPLNLDVLLALTEYLEKRLAVVDPHLFIGQRKNGLTEAAVWDVVKKYAHLAGL